jgi:hypothetical protein
LRRFRVLTLSTIAEFPVFEKQMFPIQASPDRPIRRRRQSRRSLHSSPDRRYGGDHFGRKADKARDRRSSGSDVKRTSRIAKKRRSWANPPLNPAAAAKPVEWWRRDTRSLGHGDGISALKSDLPVLQDQMRCHSRAHRFSAEPLKMRLGAGA